MVRDPRDGHVLRPRDGGGSRQEHQSGRDFGVLGFFGQKDKRSLKGGSLKRGSCGGPKGLKEMV